MCAELEREENERRDDSVALRKEMEEVAADAQARIGDLQGKLKALKIEARTMHANLTANFKSLEREYQQQEAKHALHMHSPDLEGTPRDRTFHHLCQDSDKSHHTNAFCGRSCPPDYTCSTLGKSNY